MVLVVDSGESDVILMQRDIFTLKNCENVFSLALLMVNSSIFLFINYYIHSRTKWSIIMYFVSKSQGLVNVHLIIEEPKRNTIKQLDSASFSLSQYFLKTLLVC